jgi:hypothetical protein
MDEEKLAKQMEAYKELAKDKKIDVASLMINALETSKANRLPDKQKRWAYLVSLVVPPLGLLFALKFYASDKDDAKEAAIMCVVLTGLSILLTVLFIKVVFNGSGANFDEIKNIKPQDIQELVQ